MNSYLQKLFFSIFLLFSSVLCLDARLGNDVKAGEPVDAYSSKFTNIDPSSDTVAHADVPPKPTVFDPYAFLAPSHQKSSKEENSKVKDSVTAEENIEKNRPIQPKTVVSTRPVRQEKKKMDDFFHSLTLTAHRSKKWFSDSIQKAKEIFQDEDTKKKSGTEKNLYEQGFASEQRQDYSAAVRLYKAYIVQNKIEKSEDERINADIAAPYYRLAIIAQQNDDMNSAENYFREAITYAFGHNRFIIANDFSRFLLEQNKVQDAEVVVRNIMIDYPNHQEFQRMLAQCLALQDRPIESLRHFAEVHNGNREKAYEELAQVYRTQNRWDMVQIADKKREEYALQNQKHYSPASMVAVAKPMPSTIPIQKAIPKPIPPVLETKQVAEVHRITADSSTASPPKTFVAYQPPKDRNRYIPFPVIIPKQDSEPKESTKGKDMDVAVAIDYFSLQDYSIK